MAAETPGSPAGRRSTMQFMNRRWPWTKRVPGPRRQESGPAGSASRPASDVAKPLRSIPEDLIGGIKSLSLTGTPKKLGLPRLGLSGWRGAGGGRHPAQHGVKGQPPD